MKHTAELAKTGHGQIVAAVAEPGVGKSRLFYEFKAAIPREYKLPSSAVALLCLVKDCFSLR